MRWTRARSRGSASTYGSENRQFGRPVLARAQAGRPQRTWRAIRSCHSGQRLFAELVLVQRLAAPRAVRADMDRPPSLSLPHDGGWTTCLAYLAGVCAALEDAPVRARIRWKRWEERAEPPPCVLDGVLWKLPPACPDRRRAQEVQREKAPQARPMEQFAELARRLLGKFHVASRARTNPKRQPAHSADAVAVAMPATPQCSRNTRNSAIHTLTTLSAACHASAARARCRPSR